MYGHAGRNNDYLFCKADLFSLMEHQRKLLAQDISGVAATTLRNVDVGALADKLAEKHSVNVPTLRLDEMYAEQSDVKIDVSHDQERYIRDRSRPFLMDGIRVTVTVPYDGDEAMFQIRPNTYTSTVPRADVTKNEIHWTYQGVNIDPLRLAQEKDRWLAEVQQYLQWQREGLKGFNESLIQQARTGLAQRAEKLNKDANIVASLGLPTRNRKADIAKLTEAMTDKEPRRVATPPRVVRQTPGDGWAGTRSSTAATPSRMPSPTVRAPGAPVAQVADEFDFFVSYASEDRSVVGSLVGALQEREFKVWWDKGQITLGDRLTQKIEEGLSRSRYGIVVIGRSFIAKKWTDAEIRSLANRAINTGQKVVLPVLVGINHDQFAEAYPLLADIVSTTFTGDFAGLVEEIAAAVK